MRRLWGERSLGSTLRLVTLGEGGVPVYDAVLFAGDAGSVFRHGTTKEVATRIQGSLEARNADLVARLNDALSRVERAPRRAKKVVASVPRSNKARGAKLAPARRARTNKAPTANGRTAATRRSRSS